MEVLTPLHYCRLSCIALLEADYIAALGYITRAQSVKENDSYSREEVDNYIVSATSYILSRAELIESKTLKKDILDALAVGADA